VGELTYLIRYGVMGHVGRFRAFPQPGAAPARGEIVVIQSDWGIELGEILIRLDETTAPGENRDHDRTALETAGPISVADQPRVLRRAAPEDLARAARTHETKPARFDLCQRVLSEQDWPCELIDVEPLLDESATVLLYLGPRQLDVASIRARFRVACELDVLFEQVGPGLVDEQSMELSEAPPSGGSCASCNCGAGGGGCGASAALKETSVTAAEEVSTDHAAHGSQSGCDSCGISKWMASRGTRLERRKDELGS
jgi:hypothetical protein